jgi:hypothetical protein
VFVAFAERSVFDFLEAASPHVVTELRAKYRVNADLFSTARTLGSKEEGVRSVGADRRAAVVALVGNGAMELARDLERIIRYVLDRMRLVWKTKFAGGLVAAFSGVASAGAALLEFSSAGAAFVLAIFALVGGLVTLFADFFERTPSGVRVASVEDHVRFVEMRAEVERIRRRIERDDLLPIPDAELETILGSLDEYAASVKRLAYSG